MDNKNELNPGAAEASAPAKRKLAAVQRLMRGESLEALSRELNVPAHRLSGWRDRVLLAGESALKERERDARDDEIARLQAKVGEITMANDGTLRGAGAEPFEPGGVALYFDLILRA